MTARIVAVLLWPAGLVLILAHTMGGLFPMPVFVIIDLAYVAVAVLLLRSLGARRDKAAVALVLAGVGIFALASLTGPPTAAQPAAMLANAAVLLVVAGALLAAAVMLWSRIPFGAGRAIGS